MDWTLAKDKKSRVIVQWHEHHRTVVKLHYKKWKIKQSPFDRATREALSPEGSRV